MLKYGKLALVDGLSGSSGQVATPHAVATDPVPPSEAPAPSAATPRAATVIGTGRRRMARVAAASSPAEPETGADDRAYGRPSRRHRPGATDGGADLRARRGLGARITADYEGRTLTLVSVLKGSLPFMADLMRAIDLPLRIDLMEVVSYGGATTEIVGAGSDPEGPSASIAGDDVLIVEDIIDTGLTLNY